MPRQSLSKLVRGHLVVIERLNIVSGRQKCGVWTCLELVSPFVIQHSKLFRSLTWIDGLGRCNATC